MQGVLLLTYTVLFIDGKCGDITSFGPEAVFAVHYDNWKWFFQPHKKSEVMEAIQPSFATHVWGHFFKQEIQWDQMRPDQAFYTIAEQNCPKVFDEIRTISPLNH